MTLLLWRSIQAGELPKGLCYHPWVQAIGKEHDDLAKLGAGLWSEWQELCGQLEAAHSLTLTVKAAQGDNWAARLYKQMGLVKRLREVRQGIEKVATQEMRLALQAERSRIVQDQKMQDLGSQLDSVLVQVRQASMHMAAGATKKKEDV